MTMWQPIETAPKDGRWIIALCNDGVTMMRVSWGRDRKNALCWCSTESSYGDGLFAPRGGWIEFPARYADGEYARPASKGG